MSKTLRGVSLWAGILIVATVAGSVIAKSGDSAMGDAWITAKTKMSLAADGRVKGREVSVETAKGQVTLTGKVDTAEGKAAAEEITKKIDNVKSVKNDLQVVAPSVREAVDNKDEAITARVEEAFAKHSDLREADIGIVTNAGVVSLTGEVADLFTSAKASWEAWKQDGVKSVKNGLTLKDKTKGS